MRKKFRSEHQTIANLPPLDEIAQPSIEKTPIEVKPKLEKTNKVVEPTVQVTKKENYVGGCDGKKFLEEMLGYKLNGYSS